MSVLIIILGVLMAIFGFICLFTPAVTTFGVLNFYLILLFVSGIIMLIRCIATKRFGVDFVFSILTLILCGFVVFSPQLSFVTELILLYVVAGWIVVRGCVGLFDAIRLRRVLGGGMFAFSLIVSILVILFGIYSFIHPLMFAGFLGILVSCFFIVEGIDLIVAGAITTKLK